MLFSLYVFRIRDQLIKYCAFIFLYLAYYYIDRYTRLNVFLYTL